MSDITRKLARAKAGGTYRLDGEVAALERGARAAGLDFARIGLGAVSGKKGLLDAIARALGFPDTFGANWDALADCLGDLSWREAPGHVFVIDGIAGLARNDAESVATLLDILNDTAAFWRGQKRPFFAVIAGELPADVVLPVLALHPHEHVRTDPRGPAPGCCG
jgi:RNAse (barnase) inhibitor barstar